MQYYSLVQKSFINILFENINEFVEQTYNNLIITELVLNNLVKQLPNEAESIKKEYFTNLNEQLSILTKLNTLGLNSCSSLNVNLEEMKSSGFNYLLNNHNQENVDSQKCGQIRSNLQNSYPIYNNVASFNYDNFMQNYPIPFQNDYTNKHDPVVKMSSNQNHNLNSHQNEIDFPYNNNNKISQLSNNRNNFINNLVDHSKYLNQMNTNFSNNQIVGFPPYNNYNNNNISYRQPCNSYAYQQYQYNPNQQSLWNQVQLNNFPYSKTSYGVNYNPLTNMNNGQLSNSSYPSINQSNLSSNIYNFPRIAKERHLSNNIINNRDCPKINNNLNNKLILEQINYQQSQKPETNIKPTQKTSETNKDLETSRDIDIDIDIVN